MSNRRLWFSEFTGIVLAGFLVARPFQVQGRTDFIIRFLIIVAAASIGRALSYFNSRALLAVKVVYVVGAAFIFRHFNIAFMHEDYALLVFGAGVLFLITFLPLQSQRTSFRFSEWLAATKRTFRRLRGDWTEDDERFYSEIRSGSK
jgi:hypothetical protein